MADIGTNPSGNGEALDRIAQIEALIPQVAKIALTEGIAPSVCAALLDANQDLNRAVSLERTAQLDTDTTVKIPSEDEVDSPALEAPTAVDLHDVPQPVSVPRAFTPPAITPRSRSVLHSPAPLRSRTAVRTTKAPVSSELNLAEDEAGIIGSTIQLGRRKIQAPLVTATLLKTLSKLGGDTDLPTLVAEMNSGQRHYEPAEIERLLEAVQDTFVDNGCHEAWVDQVEDGVRVIRIAGFRF